MNLMLEIKDMPVNDLLPQIVGELTQADLRRLEKPRPAVRKQSALKRLTERHRNVARAVASGMPVVDVAAFTGLTPATIHNYKKDPSFMNLVAFMGKEIDIVYETIHEKLTGLSIDAMEALRDKMEDPDEKISVGQYIEIAKLGLDRSGHGPQSTQNVNINDGLADRLAAARKRIAERTIEATALEIEDATSTDEGTNLREATG